MGPLLPLLMAAGPLISRIAGGAAKGSADQRQNEYQQNLQRTQLQNNDALLRTQLMNNASTTRAQMQNSDAVTRAGLDMQRKQFQQSEPGTQARQAMTGSMLSRIQPLQMSGLSDRVSARMPKMNSIIDSIGPDARQAGSLLAQRGLSGLQGGPTQFSEMPPVSLPDLPNLPPATIMAMQKSGLLEKIMGGLSLGGSVLGAFGSMGKPTSGNGLPIDPYGGG